MKRTTGILFSLIIFAIYFVFASQGHFYNIFTVFFPKFHLIFLVCALVCGTFAAFCKKKCIFSSEFVSKLFFLIIPVSMGAACLIVNLRVVIAPQPDDGIHYVWLAKMIAHGKVYMELPDYYEHYFNNFLSVHDGKYASIFLPGFSFFMAPFAALGVPYLLNPILAGINTYLVGKHAVALKDRTAGIIAMILFVFSTTHILHGAFYFPHHFGLMLVLVSSYIVLYKNYSFKNYLLAGFILSISLFIRPQNAFYTYFATAVLIVFKERSIKPLIWFTIPFVATGSALMGFNYYFTGNPGIFIQDIYFNVLNTRKFCHRPGFGKGCLGNHGDWLPKEGVTFEFAKGISFLRLNSFLYKSSVYPLMLVFIFPAILKNPYKYFLYYFMPLCAVAAYFTFYIEGNFAGPRYFMESGALFLIAAACGFTEIYNYLIGKNTFISRFSAGSLIGLLLAAIIFFSTVLFPSNVFESRNDANSPYEIKEYIEKNKIENSIVLLPFSIIFHFHSIMTIQDNPPHDKFGNLIMYSMGDYDSDIQKFYKDTGYRSIWRIYKNNDSFAGQQLEFIEDDGKYRVEFESKFIPVYGTPYFILGIWDHLISEEFKFIPNGSAKFRFMALGVLFQGTDERLYGFEHSVKNGGNYELELAIAVTECTAGFDIEINGIKTAHYKPEKGQVRIEKFKFSSSLKAGKNIFKIIPEKDGCIILDYMDMKKSSNK